MKKPISPIDEQIVKCMEELEFYEDGSDRKRELIEQIDKMNKLQNDYIRASEEKKKRILDYVKCGCTVLGEIALLVITIRARNKNLSRMMLYETEGIVSSFTGKEIAKEALKISKI